MYNYNILLYLNVKGVHFVYQMIIIDDEPLVLEYLTEFINNEFPEIQVAANFDVSSKAVSYLKGNSVDIVLTDISMPEPTGIDIAELCHESFPQTVVIFLSAYKEFEYAHSAITFNVHDYILKPLSKNHLIKSLSSAIELLNKRNNEPKLSGFASNEYLLACQAVFSDLMCSSIRSEAELNEKFLSINLPVFMTDNPAVIFSLQIENMTDYLNNNWKYGKPALFDTLFRLVCTETESVFFAPVWYVQDKIELIGIAKKTNIDYEQIKSEFNLQIVNKVSKTMKLDITPAFIKELPAVKSMLSDNQSIENDKDLAKKFYNYIEQNYKNHISLEDAAKHFNFSRVYFSVYYKKCIGENFSTTLTKIRIEKAKELLKNPHAKVSAVMREVGYNHSTHFHNTFKKIVGCSPAEYQKNL